MPSPTARLTSAWRSSLPRSSASLRASAGAGLQRPVRLGAGDGDHRLLGEGLQQLDLAVGEAAALSAPKGERADRRAAAYQRDQNARLDRQAPHGGA